MLARNIMTEDTHQGVPDDWMEKIETQIGLGRAAEIPLAASPRPKIMLCIPTFNRAWQLVQTLPTNLVQAWQLRECVTFVLADLNYVPMQDMVDLMTKCKAAIECGFLRVFRRQVRDEDGFDTWHASVGKNTAHVCVLMIEPTGILVELDNDNFVSQQFFGDILDNGDDLMSGSLAGMRWRHPASPPCSGRTRESVVCPRGAIWLGCQGIYVAFQNCFCDGMFVSFSSIIFGGNSESRHG